MSRYRAAALHLLISGAVIAGLLGIAVALWYPGAFFSGLGGAHLVATLGMVDICLGPLITLIIFDTRKPKLRYDLATVALVQAAALAYGGWVMFEARPVYSVFIKDVFKVARANELEEAELAQASRPEFARRPIDGPRFVASRLPASREEVERLLFAGVTQGIDLHQLPRYYIPYAEARQEILAAARPLGGPRGVLAGDRSGALAAALKSSGRKPESVRYLPLLGTRHEMSVLVDAASGEVVDVVDAAVD
ncbi:MAG: hypothetical protein JNM82_09790 [Rhodocyclaceae bacterium]|nr:hypothetical protein [Rhodocyclaceae bacterium]